LGACSHEPLTDSLPWEEDYEVPTQEPKTKSGPPEMIETAPAVEDEIEILEDVLELEGLPAETPMWIPGGPTAVPIPTPEMIEEANVTPRDSTVPLAVSGRAAVAAAQFTDSELASKCEVCGNSMKHSPEPVLANLQGREFIVCGEGCIASLRSDPRRFLSQVDHREVIPVPPVPERKVESDVVLRGVAP
jgi:hypothetical protein